MKSFSGREFRVIWAVDPASDARLMKNSVRAIRAMTQGRRATISPVYFLSEFLDSTPSQSVGDTLALTHGKIRSAFEKQLGRSGLVGLKPLTVLTGVSLTRWRMMLELTDYASRHHADVIVVATHGRTGIKRWFIGSFADAMMHESKVPLLIVNPHWEEASGFSNILFPTDFSDVSKAAFLKVIEYSKAAGARVTLFHRIALTITPEMHLLVQRPSDYRRVRDQQVADCRVRANDWAKEGDKRGVDVAIVVDASGLSSVADAVLKQQRLSGGVIALASRSGEISTQLLGRTTRALIQGTRSAVWVLHPAVKMEATSGFELAA